MWRGQKGEGREWGREWCGLVQGIVVCRVCNPDMCRLRHNFSIFSGGLSISAFGFRFFLFVQGGSFVVYEARTLFLSFFVPLCLFFSERLFESQDGIHFGSVYGGEIDRIFRVRRESVILRSIFGESSPEACDRSLFASDQMICPKKSAADAHAVRGEIAKPMRSGRTWVHSP